MGFPKASVESFDQHVARLHREKLEADKLETQAAETKNKLSNQISRVKTGLPLEDACPDCWVLRGETNIIVAHHHPNPDKFDRMGCPKCSWGYDTPVGL